MPRQSRKSSNTGIYHVMLRGINRQDIFEDSEDYQKFIRCLNLLLETYDEQGYRVDALCDIYAYCLMPNHVHIIIHEKTAPIGDIMKKLTVSYAFYFNKKYQRFGHLFQDRFRSEPVEDIGYFKTLLRYIHLNPVHAGLVTSAGDYDWSSWHEYEKRNTGITDICNSAAVLRRIPWEELYDYVCGGDDSDGGIFEMDNEPPRSITDNAIKVFLSTQYGIKNLMELQNIDKKQRNEIIIKTCEQGAGFRQLARITGISYGIIQRVVVDSEPSPDLPA